MRGDCRRIVYYGHYGYQHNKSKVILELTIILDTWRRKPHLASILQYSPQVYKRHQAVETLVLTQKFARARASFQLKYSYVPPAWCEIPVYPRWSATHSVLCSLMIGGNSLRSVSADQCTLKLQLFWSKLTVLHSSPYTCNDRSLCFFLLLFSHRLV